MVPAVKKPSRRSIVIVGGLVLGACAGGDDMGAPTSPTTTGTEPGSTAGTAADLVGDSDDPPACPEGTADCPCTPEQTCDPGYTCFPETNTCHLDDCPKDEFEPNDKIGEATDLAGRRTITANNAIYTDYADWYRFRVPGDSQSRTVTATITADASALRCMLIECDQGRGNIVVDGCGASDYLKLEGLLGCCTKATSLTMEFYCFDSPADAQDATIYFTSHAPEQECLDYTAQFDY